MPRLAQLTLTTLLLTTVAATSPPVESLTSHLAALKDTTTLSANFLCEKKLAALETPLLSRGQLWIQKGDASHGGDGAAIRFSTEKPYTSELILTNGKVLARSQHETEWTKTNQSSRPGLTAVMSQLGGWSTGDAGKLAEEYTIAASNGPIPTMPSSNGPAQSPKPEADVYTLTPTNKDLLKAIKKITLAVDKKSHILLFLEILTQQDDTTRYWFYNVQTNKPLPENIFSPNTVAPQNAVK
jgi:outer membrane lipoprotein-sorting protein